MCSKFIGLIIAIFILTLGSVFVIYFFYLPSSEFDGPWVPKPQEYVNHADSTENSTVKTEDASKTANNVPESTELSQVQTESSPITSKVKDEESTSPIATDVKDGKSTQLPETQNELQPSQSTSDATRPPKRASLLQHLVDEYLENENNLDKQLEVMKKLVDLVDKYDNGVNLFSQTNALQSVLLPALKSPSEEIRSTAARIFSVGSQNNPTVQSTAVKGGALQALVRLMKFDPVVRPVALSAIRHLLGNYNQAQRQLIKDGSITELVTMGYLPEIQNQILRFMSDMLNERRLCQKYSQRPELYSWDANSLIADTSDDPCDDKHLLKQALEDSDWWKLLCQSVRYVDDSKYKDIPEHEQVVIEAVWASLDFCAEKMGHLQSNFEQLLEKYDANSPKWMREYRKKLEDILAAIYTSQTESSSGVSMSYGHGVVVMCLGSHLVLNVAIL